MRRLVVLVSLALGLSASTAHASAIVVGTNNRQSSFGETATPAVGQTFTSIGSVMNDFTFAFDDFITGQHPGFTIFQAYLYAWDEANNRPTGPQLYQSPTLSTTNNGGLGGNEFFTLNMGATPVANGNQYILFFSVFGLTNGIPDAVFFPVEQSNVGGFVPYPGGDFVFSNASSFGNLFNTNAWTPVSSLDLSFTANFDTVQTPEPMSMALVGTGLVTLGRSLRRRRKA